MRNDGTGLAAGWILLAVWGSACGQSPRTRTIESSREVSVAGSDLHLGAKNDERFGLRTPSAAHTETEPPPSTLVWDTPPGWTELAPSAMRNANFRVAGDARAECYLTLLSGEAGGLAANINRWRTQMSQPLAGADAIAAMPRAQFFGQEAVLVDITGAFGGMSGGSPQPGYRLVGLLLVEPAGSAFLKMVGPESVIGPHIDAFHTLARSFRSKGEPPRPAPETDTPNTSSTASGIAWTMPSEWKRAPERATRAVSFFVGGDESVECYVTILGGDAGGALANVNRWRGQMGQAEITAQELAGLPRIPMLGGEGIVAQIDSAAREQSGALDTRMLGAVGELAGRAVFVKLTGPRTLVESERDAFVAFCSSLTQAK